MVSPRAPSTGWAARYGWPILVPLAGIAVVVGVPFVRHAAKVTAEDTASGFLEQVHEGQRAFRASHGDAGYASALDSLTRACPGASAAAVPASAVVALLAREYATTVRPADGAETRRADCHGRPLVSDYYAAAFPSTVGAGQQAFATTASGRIFLFFDGVPPLERDMSADGLATPLDARETFTIP